jgi:hypothetical protein
MSYYVLDTKKNIYSDLTIITEPLESKQNITECPVFEPFYKTDYTTKIPENTTGPLRGPAGDARPVPGPVGPHQDVHYDQGYDYEKGTQYTIRQKDILLRVLLVMILNIKNAKTSYQMKMYLKKKLGMKCCVIYYVQI